MEFHVPSDSASRLDLALAHYRNDDLAGAELFCRDAIETSRDEAGGWFLLGMIAKKRGDQKLAEEYLEQAFRLKANPVPKGFQES